MEARREPPSAVHASMRIRSVAQVPLLRRPARAPRETHLASASDLPDLRTVLWPARLPAPKPGRDSGLQRNSRSGICQVLFLVVARKTPRSIHRSAPTSDSRRRSSIDQEVGPAEHCCNVHPELLGNHAESAFDPVENPPKVVGALPRYMFPCSSASTR